MLFSLLTYRQNWCIMILPAKVLYEIVSDAVFLLLNRPYHTIESRPPDVTLAATLTLAGSDEPQSDTGGRSISRPGHATGPPKRKKPGSYQPRFLEKWA